VSDLAREQIRKQMEGFFNGAAFGLLDLLFAKGQGLDPETTLIARAIAGIMTLIGLVLGLNSIRKKGFTVGPRTDSFIYGFCLIFDLPYFLMWLFSGSFLPPLNYLPPPS
jgi:hypothetical protein